MRGVVVDHVNQINACNTNYESVNVTPTCQHESQKNEFGLLSLLWKVELSQRLIFKNASLCLQRKRYLLDRIFKKSRGLACLPYLHQEHLPLKCSSVSYIYDNLAYLQQDPLLLSMLKRVSTSILFVAENIPLEWQLRNEAKI